jgi:type II secretory pathway component PulK
MMDHRRGFALLAVLWLLAALGIVAAVGLAAGRMGAGATRNRMLLTRAGWAREACVAILHARVGEDSLALAPTLRLRGLPPVDLGRGTWCAARLEDPAARLNLNVADSATLARLLGSPERAAAVLDRRRRTGPLADVAELGSLPGFDSATVARLADLATVRGSGAVNVNEASAEVLGVMAGLPQDARDVVLRRRRTGHPVANLDELLALSARPTREAMLRDYGEWLARVTFSSGSLVAWVTGGVAGTPITSTVALTLAPVAGRLAVLRRESE